MEKKFTRIFQSLRKQRDAYIAEKNWRKALEVLDEMIDMRPNKSTLYARRGAVLVKVREYQKAAEDLKRALLLNPDLEVAKNTLVKISEKIGSLPEDPGETHFDPGSQQSQKSMEPYVMKKGSIFGQYEILEKVEEGGMGAVYRALDKKLQRTVAIKVISLGGISPSKIERFMLEARAIARLEHPNIVKLFEVGDSPQHYFTMEFIDGGSLDEIVAKEKLKPRLAAEIACKIARAVHEAHRKDIIHRDIKPSNIMIDAYKEPKLLDFGLVKMDDTQISKSGDLLGTPAYMSPEQLEGRKVDGRTDVYAIGVTMYHMLAGQVPFQGATSWHVLHKICSEQPVPLSKLCEIPSSLETICRKAMDKDPKHRYQSALELAEDLDCHLKNQPLKHAKSFARLSRSFQFGIARYRRILIAGIILILVAMLSWPLLGESSKKILLVFSYEKDLIWDKEIRTAIYQVFEKDMPLNKYPWVIEEHYMETKKYSSPQEVLLRVKAAQDKIRESDADLVITMDDNASSKVIPAFLNTPTPFIFCGVNRNPKEYGYPQNNVTGVWENLFIVQTFQMLPYFLPEAKKYALLIEESNTGKIVHGIIREGLKNASKENQYELVSEHVSAKFSDWQTFVKKYESEVDFFLVPVYLNLKDDNGNLIPSRDIMKWIVENVSKPPIGVLGFNVKEGALFGVVETGYTQGRQAAQYAVEILMGRKTIEELPVTRIERGEVYINQKTAQRFGIKIPEWLHPVATVLD